MLDQTLYDRYFISEVLQAAMLSYAEREHHRRHSPVAEAADEDGAVSAGELVRMDATWYDSFPARGALQTYLATLLRRHAGPGGTDRQFHRARADLHEKNR